MTEVEKHFREVMKQDAGARYYKVDLHIHTPSSADQKYNYSQEDAREDIKKGYERALEIAGQILDEFRDEGISVAAFTDHNSPGYVDNADFGSGSWYELVKEVYEQRRKNDKNYPKLLLLPGVEITTDRIHILGIFDDQDEHAIFKIASLLRSVDIREGEFGEVRGVFGTKSIWEVAAAIDELGGICIPAHINQDNMRSLLRQFQPPDMEIERLVQHRAIHVFGVVPPKCEDLERPKELSEHSREQDLQEEEWGQGELSRLDGRETRRSPAASPGLGLHDELRCPLHRQDR